MSLKKKDPKRRALIANLRKEGNYMINRPVYQTQIEEEIFPCIHCKGLYKKKSLHRHIKKCFLNQKKK